MYNERKPIPKKKMIELIIIICILLWVLFFIINYVRYTNDNPPLLSLPVATRKCDDGKVYQYYAIGYVYRKYNSTSTNYTEFVPFWKGLKACPETGGLPVVPKEFDVPANPKRLTTYRGISYFYDRKVEILGAYPCINTEDKCDVAASGYDEYNIKDTDELYKVDPKPHMHALFNKYGFVDDSVEQDKEYGDKQYVRTIYYYDMNDHKILERFGDVKYSRIDAYNYGLGDEKNRYIIRDYDTRKWGLLKFKKDGTYKQILKFEYNSINYDEDTGYYILNKDNKWSVYDLDNNKYILENKDDIIYDIWQNGNLTYYYKIGVTYDKETSFRVLNLDNAFLLNKEHVIHVLAKKKYIMYITSNDKKIHFIDYTGEEKETPIQLYFLSLYSDSKTHPAFTYEAPDDEYTVSIRVYKGPEYKYEYESHFISITSWN